MLQHLRVLDARSYEHIPQASESLTLPAQHCLRQLKGRCRGKCLWLSSVFKEGGCYAIQGRHRGEGLERKQHKEALVGH